MARKYPDGKYVYLHIRESDGLVFYVGQGVKYRAWSSGDRSSHWFNTVGKHGYYVEIVDHGITKDEADILEIFLIWTLSKAGYPIVNKTVGGEGAHGRIMTEKNLIAISKPVYSSMGEYFKSGADAVRHMGTLGYSTLSISMISSAIYKDHAAFDRNWSFTEFPEHTAIPYEQRIQNLLDSNKRKIFCSSGDMFECVNDAAKWCIENGFPNASHSSIANCARLERGSAYGFSWSYNGMPSQPIDVGADASAKSKSKPVVSNKHGWFESASAGARFLNVSGYPKAGRASITWCCKGNLKTAYGSSWKYADE